jgi:hypothetical protein
MQVSDLGEFAGEFPSEFAGCFSIPFAGAAWPLVAHCERRID